MIKINRDTAKPKSWHIQSAKGCGNPEGPVNQGRGKGETPGSEVSKEGCAGPWKAEGGACRKPSAFPPPALELREDLASPVGG